jgi:hypothetical protein
MPLVMFPYLLSLPLIRILFANAANVSSLRAADQVLLLYKKRNHSFTYFNVYVCI